MKAHEKRLRELVDTPGLMEGDDARDLSRLLDDVERKRGLIKGALRASDCSMQVRDLLVEALKSSTKSKRSHVCVTRSGDEQVTCDDPKCPRKP